MNQSLLSEITQDVFDNVPNYDERKAMLARDPLASCEGFHTLVRLVLRHLFGVRFCQNCPQCAVHSSPCTDAFGSNAMACGGTLGRVDAAYGAVEFQKAGSAHVHFQLFVQCIHQHTPLSEMAKRYESVLQEMLRRAGKYNAHVRRTVYCDPADWDERRREVVEQAWPEYRDEVLMLSRPAYQADESLSGDEWKEQFFVKDAVTAATHQSQHCAKRCHEACRPEELVREAQTTQAAQAGYACDYQNKRLPIAIHELKDRRLTILPPKLDTPQLRTCPLTPRLSVIRLLVHPPGMAER